MTCRILVVGDIDHPTAWLRDLDGPVVDRRTWPPTPAAVSPHAADLLIAIAAHEPQAVEMLEWLRATPPAVPVLAILPEVVSPAVLRLLDGVTADFVLGPSRTNEIVARVHRAAAGPRDETAAVCDRLLGTMELGRLVGRDEAFLRVVRQIPLMARSNRAVLITGETGTGKELCARALHHLGARRRFPFIPVECGGFPDQLFENEMFGHERGAFTDAHRRQRGLVAMAEGGTLFLDEIDSLSPASQAKLLRFLQERTYRPLGSSTFLHADVNVVAATNRDLDALVREQRFRPDLFFRLNVLRLALVPLRARRDDIGILAQHFLDEMSAEEGVPRKALAPQADAMLRSLPWPGNVRELHNVMQRAFVFAGGPVILAADVATAIGDSPGPVPLAAPDAYDVAPFRDARARAVEAFERQYLVRMLKAHQGNITQAAKRAGQDRRAFGRLVKRHQIDRRSLG